MISQIPVSCNRDCGGGCPLLAVVEDGRLMRIVDNPARGPYMAGCARGYQMARVVYAPDRLRVPLLRVGPRGSAQFREAGWPEALDYVADRLADVRARHGARSVLRLGGSGSCRGALHHTGWLTARFLAFFGGSTETHGSYSCGAIDFMLPYVIGAERTGGYDPGTLQYSSLIVLWGANVADVRFGSETYARIKEAKARGVPVIVIDPRRTATVEQLATDWIPVRPGTDAALMLAVLYVLLTEDRIDRRFLDDYTVGFEPLERYVLGRDGDVAKTPAWAEAICGTPAPAIVDLARRYGQAHPVALMQGFSIQRTVGGEETVRLSIALQAATGNIGVPGGTTGSYGWPGQGQPIARHGALRAPVVPDQPSVPVYRWPDAVLDGTAGGYATDIRAIYNVGGDYLVQGSDVHKNIRAFEKVEFSVCHDLFLTPTAAYCDVVLPATTWLERNDIVFPINNFLMYSNRAIAPQGEARDDYDIFCGLAERLGFLGAFSEGKDEDAWLRSFAAASDIPDYDEFRRTGLFMGQDQLRVGLRDFVADPGAHPLPTPSGRIEISSARYEAETGYAASPRPYMLPPDPAHPLRLVTPKSRFRVHSQLANIAWFREREPQALWINPADARPRRVHDGASVLITSPEGRVRVPCRVTDDVMPGVVSLLAGVWPVFDAEGTDVAGSANVLTSTAPTLPSGSSRTHSVLVQVRAA